MTSRSQCGRHQSGTGKLRHWPEALKNAEQAQELDARIRWALSWYMPRTPNPASVLHAPDCLSTTKAAYLIAFIVADDRSLRISSAIHSQHLATGADREVT